MAESGDALSASDIQAAITLEGPADLPDPQSLRVGCLDLGLKRDHSGFCLLEARPGAGRVKLLLAKKWAPGIGGRVDLIGLQSDILDIHRRFRMNILEYDPWNAGAIAQNFQQAGLRTCEVPFTPANVDAMARVLIEAFREQRIDLFDDEDLIRGLHKLSIQERAWGYRLTAPRDGHGHEDVAISFSIGLPMAWEIANSPPVDPYTAGLASGRISEYVYA